MHALDAQHQRHQVLLVVQPNLPRHFRTGAGHRLGAQAAVLHAAAHHLVNVVFRLFIIVNNEQVGVRRREMHESEQEDNRGNRRRDDERNRIELCAEEDAHRQRSIDLFNPAVATVPPFDNNDIILEVKYNQVMPPYIRDLLNYYCPNALSSAISKYTWCRRFEAMEV